MPKRFIFRQFHLLDLPVFAEDGEIRSKNHCNPQACHQTSYEGIVSRRGSAGFRLPNGHVVNEYVPFYFSPKTGFTFTISQGNVGLRSPEGNYLRQASDDDRAFFVGRAKHLIESELNTVFSSVALNSMATPPIFGDTVEELKSTVSWQLFDDDPMVATIPEIGYNGVCRWFHDRDSPPWQQNRKAQRMAEFLVLDAVPLDALVCIVVKTAQDHEYAEEVLQQFGVDLPVYTKPGCFY